MNNENVTTADRLEVDVYLNKIVECRLFISDKLQGELFLQRDTDRKLLQHFAMNPWPISTEDLAIHICDPGEDIDIGDRTEQLHTAIHRLNNLFENTGLRLISHNGNFYSFSLPIILKSNKRYFEVSFEGEKLIP